MHEGSKTRTALTAFSIISALYFVGFGIALFVELVLTSRYVNYDILGWVHLFTGAVLVLILLILWLIWIYAFGGHGYQTKTKVQLRRIKCMICYFAFYYIVTIIPIWRWPRESGVEESNDLSSSNEHNLHLQLILASFAVLDVALLWFSMIGISSLISTGMNNTLQTK